MIGTHKTTVSTSDGVTRVTYHTTNVVTFDTDKITLRTGGWPTKTTKLRMNQASEQFDLGYRVYQKDFDWYVVATLDDESGFDWDNPVEFVEHGLMKALTNPVRLGTFDLCLSMFDIVEL